MIRVVSAFIVAILAAGCAKAPSLQPQVLFDLSDKDFGSFSAQATLESIGSISESADSPVSVGFVINGEPKVFIFSTREIFSRWGLSIDTPHFNVSYDRITHDDEEVSIDEASNRIRKYADAARLTDSRPAFRLSASPGAKNSALVVLLDMIASEGVLELLSEPGEQAVVANPPPPRVGTPYKIQPEDLFQTGAP